MGVQHQRRLPIRSVMKKEIPFIPPFMLPGTVISDPRSLFPIGCVSGNVVISVPRKLFSKDERLTFDDICGRIHAFLENKNSEIEDDDDNDAQDDDDDDDEEDY